MAETVLRDEGVKEEIHRMHTERLTAMSQTAIPHFQATATQSGIRNTNGPISIPLNAVEAESSVPSLPTIQPISSSIRPPSLLSLPVHPPQMVHY